MKDLEDADEKSHKEGQDEALADGEEHKEKPKNAKPKKKVTAPVKPESKKDLSKDNRI